MLSNGETQASIIEDFPELEPQDIQAALSYAADCERRVYGIRARTLKTLLDYRTEMEDVLIRQDHACIEIT